jgi:hypothetical protein
MALFRGFGFCSWSVVYRFIRQSPFLWQAFGLIVAFGYFALWQVLF